MKKKLVMSLLGAAAAVGFATSAHAQGHVIFENYGNSTSAITTYGAGAGGTVGAGVDTTFTAGLYYFLGTTTGAAGNDVPGSGWELDAITTQYETGNAAGQPGYFVGPSATISDYTSGAITFEVTAYNGSDYASSSVRAHSTAFTVSGIATGTSGVGEFGPGLSSWSVTPVTPTPEPSVLALSGIGAAALMLIRRKK